MHAKDIMITDVICVRKEDTLTQVMSVLMKNHVGGVPVVDNDNQLVGMVTEKDLVTSENGLNISSYMEFMTSILLLDGKNPDTIDIQRFNSMTAQDIMSTHVYAVQPAATVEEIASLMMNRHINRIPVVDENNTLLGIIGRSDLLPILIKQ